jgi:dienelactone hydrolase
MTISPEQLSPARLRQLFGMESRILRFRTSHVDVHGKVRTERLTFETGRGELVRGIVTRPVHVENPLPAILYAHAHGGRYDIGAEELVAGRPELLGPLGPVFAEAGYVTLAIDMPTFGERRDTTESAAAKAAIWYGRSLFGAMLSDQAAALAYLASRSDVDAHRIGAFGLSMGSMLSYWLAAVEPRIAAVAHLCCFADFASMVASGAHDGHGFYLVVPGLLNETSTGAIAGLVAPRPQLICVGGSDKLTPAAAVDRAWEEARSAYAEAGAADAITLMRIPDVGHEETREMRDAVLKFFKRTLKL